MKVLQISAMNYSSKSYNSRKNNTNDEVTEGTQPSFKGLWGKEKYSKRNNDEILNRYYYPFKDETLKEINMVKNEYTGTSCNQHGGQGIVEYLFQKCNINQTLPFTEAEWNQYSYNKFGMKPSVKNYIEDSLKRFNLKHYIR